jgi:acetoin utilization deacetylase AcuC-like enzyme
MDAIPVFYGEEMLANSDSRSPSAAKPKPVVAAWEHAGLPIEQRPTFPATVDELCLAHDPNFVRSILSCQAENGFGNCRPDVAAALPYTTGALLHAASFALQCGIACAPCSGFHHAGYAIAQMFCTFNGLVVAARKLLNAQRVKRVLILDLDYHYGNGTDEIIERLGLEQQIENATFGRWYSSSAQAANYLEHLNRVIDTFRDFDLVLYQAGADLHVDDPLGGVLDSAQMRERDRRVFEGAHRAGVPLAWDLAGGYQEPLSKVLAIHLATMQECVRVYCC